jgi:signal transduction histidine kinase
MSRAFNGVHPAESFHACTALFESFLDHVHRAVQTMPYTTADRLLKRTLYVYNSSVGLRVQSAMRGYDAFLLTKVRNANSDDRTRLARDIHDHLGSSLAMILRCLELHEAHEMQGPPGDRLRSAYAFLDEALYYTRTLVGNLRITTPRAGIEESLADFLADIQYDSPTTRVKVSGDEQWLTRDLSGELFVILRECLRNALNHAGAECIEVAVDIAPHEINAYVVDDGKGFDASATLRSTVASGLSSVRERVKELGGQVHWTSIDGKGTKVVVHVPYTRSAEWAGLR